MLLPRRAIERYWGRVVTEHRSIALASGAAVFKFLDLLSGGLGWVAVEGSCRTPSWMWMLAAGALTCNVVPIGRGPPG